MIKIITQKTINDLITAGLPSHVINLLIPICNIPFENNNFIYNLNIILGTPLFGLHGGLIVNHANCSYDEVFLGYGQPANGKILYIGLKEGGDINCRNHNPDTVNRVTQWNNHYKNQEFVPRADFHQGTNYSPVLNANVPISISPYPVTHYIYWEDTSKTWKGLCWLTLSALGWVTHHHYTPNDENLRTFYMQRREFARYRTTAPYDLVKNEEPCMFMPNSNDCIIGITLPFLDQIINFHSNDNMLINHRLNRIINIINRFDFRAIIIYGTNKEILEYINIMLGINFNTIPAHLVAGHPVKIANYVNGNGISIRCLNVLHPVAGRGYGREYAVNIGSMI